MTISQSRDIIFVKANEYFNVFSALREASVAQNERDNTVLNNNIMKSLREQSGLTLAEVASQGDVNAAHLSMIECGHRLPKLDTLERILGVYGYTLRVEACKSSMGIEAVCYLWDSQKGRA